MLLKNKIEKVGECYKGDSLTYMVVRCEWRYNGYAIGNHSKIDHVDLKKMFELEQREQANALT
jgi:hypothetical protein